MRMLDAPALVALSDTSTYFRHLATATRAVWIKTLNAVYRAHGAAAPDQDTLLCLPTEELRRRVLRPHKARWNMSRPVPRPTSLRRITTSELFEGLVGMIVGFYVLPGADFVFVAETGADWSLLALWALPTGDVGGVASIVARWDFDVMLCCVDVQLADGGTTLRVVASVESLSNQSFVHHVMRLDVPNARTSVSSGFELLATMADARMPIYLSLSNEHVALNLNNGRLMFWAWRTGQQTEVLIEDAAINTADAWALQFRSPHAFVCDATAGVVRQYTLPDRVATGVYPLPAVWRRGTGNNLAALWSHGTLLTSPTGAAAFVHAGIVNHTLVHCIIPATGGRPFCLSHTLPRLLRSDARVVHVGTLAESIVALVEAGGSLHAILTDWDDISEQPRVSPNAPAQRTGAFRLLLDGTISPNHVAVSPAAVDAISGRVVFIQEHEDRSQFVVVDFAE